MEIQIAKDWNDYLNWCESNGFKPGNGKVLRAYVKILREGKWKYV